MHLSYRWGCKSIAMNTCSKSLLLCDSIIPVCIRCVDSLTAWWQSLGVAGWVWGWEWGAADSEEERKGKVQREQREKKADREWDREVWCAGLRASVSCRGLQMALRIKSKLCWLPRNGLCDTSGATWEGGKTGAEGGGWRRGAAATEWKSPSNEFLKYLKINCLWKSSTDSWYAGWMGAKWKVALSLHFSSSQPLLYLGIIHFLTFHSLPCS